MRRRSDGATVVEVLLSLAIVLVGMLALLRLLASSVTTARARSRRSEAQVRAQSLVEAIRRAPPETLHCLEETPARRWSECQAACTRRQSAQACRYLNLDGNSHYAVLSDDDLRKSSWVHRGGASGRLRDMQVSIGFVDDLGRALDSTRVTLRTGIFE